MSDADKQSKTFDPTPRRIQKARDEGQVAKSREVATAAVILSGGIALMVSGDSLSKAVFNGTRASFSRSAEAATDLSAVWDVFGQTMGSITVALLPFFGVICVAAVLSHVGQTGILIAPKALMPKMSRINLFSRLKEVLGPGPALVRTGVALLKMLFVGLVVVLVAEPEIRDVRLMASRNVEFMLIRLGSGAIRIFIAAGLALAVVALIDFVYQKHKYITGLKMTRDEVKQENKEDEGSPETKGRRKQMYRELTLNRVMEEVPRADVIVTNPSHFAVALRYEAGKDFAPRVVAKGIDALALTIRRIARQNGVPIVENRRLARTLHKQVKVGRPVSEELFAAVAEVLAHVYRLKHGDKAS